MKIYTLLFIAALTTSCSLANRNKKINLSLDKYKHYSNQDYLDQVNEFKKFYFHTETVKQVKLYKREKEYLSSIVKKIKKKNELFFENNIEENFYIVDSTIPFYFSLPNGTIFLSKNLLSIYTKNESILYCILAYELIRIEKKLYYKKLIIPTGTMTTSRILSLLRLNIREKVEIHKWAYYLLKRTGINTDNYLTWIQIQNRNANNFSLQLGDTRSISREETLFKSFLIKEKGNTITLTEKERSSKSFYNLINKIKRI